MPGATLSVALGSFTASPLAPGNNNIACNVQLTGDVNTVNNNKSSAFNYPLPVFSVFASKPVSCKGDTVWLTALPGNQYTWNGVNLGTNKLSFVAAQSVTVLVSTTSTLTGCSRQLAFICEVDECAGLNKAGDNELIQVFPNPVSDRLHIEVPGSVRGTTYQITDQLGKIVLSERLENERSTIDVSTLKGGVYFVQVAACRKKIIK